MATITVTRLFTDTDFWPGFLFEANDDTEILEAGPTRGRIRHAGPDDPASGYSLTITGTGFVYDQGLPVEGTVKTLRVLDPQGRTVITITDLAPGTVASDLSGMIFNIFGAESPDEGPGPDGYNSWTHLLSGNDTINWSSGNDDIIFPGADGGDDLYNMGAGDDWAFGGIGNDTLHGSDGFDTLSYFLTHYREGGTAVRGATFTVNADGSGTVLDPWGGTDTFTGMERFQGSRFGDVYFGADGEDIVSGLRGADTLHGGGGTDDELAYLWDFFRGGPRGIRVNLETSFINGESRGRIVDGFGTVDMVTGFEEVAGTRFGDSFLGSRGGDTFWGGEGQDSYNGRAGFDTVGFDAWFGNSPPGPVVVDMRLATGQVIDDGFGNTETMIGIEEVIGADGNDVLQGNAASQHFTGKGGSDTMVGHGGRDDFIWNEQPVAGEVDTIGDFRAGGAAGQRDELSFEMAGFANMTNALVLVNGPAATAAVGTFVFNAAIDTLFWDRDGTGAAAAQPIVVLVNVNALTAASFDLFA